MLIHYKMFWSIDWYFESDYWSISHFSRYLHGICATRII